MPQLVKSGVVHRATSFPLSKSQTLTSPIMFAAARCRLSGLNATESTGGTCANAQRNSPVWALITLTLGSVSTAGSYLYPPGRYWPVALAIHCSSGETCICQDQNLWASTVRIGLPSIG